MQRAYADAKGLRRAAVARAWKGRSQCGGTLWGPADAAVGPLLMQQWGTLLSARGDWRGQGEKGIDGIG